MDERKGVENPSFEMIGENMKVYSRAINAGETFCTSKKRAIEVFKNTEIKLCFGEFKKKYSPYQNEIGFGYYKRNIHGQVVSNIVFEPGLNCPMLSFYVIKSSILSNSMKEDFEEKILCQLRNMYDKFCIANAFQQKTTVVWVELISEQFYIHQFTPK